MDEGSTERHSKYFGYLAIMDVNRSFDSLTVLSAIAPIISGWTDFLECG